MATTRLFKTSCQQFSTSWLPNNNYVHIENDKFEDTFIDLITSLLSEFTTFFLHSVTSYFISYLQPSHKIVLTLVTVNTICSSAPKSIRLFPH